MSRLYPDDMSLDKLSSMKLPEDVDDLLALCDQVLAYLQDPKAQQEELKKCVENEVAKHQEMWNRRN